MYLPSHQMGWKHYSETRVFRGTRKEAKGARYWALQRLRADIQLRDHLPKHSTPNELYANKKRIVVCISLKGARGRPNQNRCDVYWQAIPHELEHVKQCCSGKKFDTPEEEEYEPWKVQCTNKFKTSCQEYTEQDLEDCIKQGTSGSVAPAVRQEFEQKAQTRCR